MAEEDLIPNDIEQLHALVRDDALWELGELVPVPAANEAGRRRSHHGSAIIYFLVCVQLFKGHRAASRQLRDSHFWMPYVLEFRRRYPDRPDLWPDLSKPIRRHHYATFKAKYVTDETGFVEQVRAVIRAHAIRQADQLDLCAERNGGSMTHPHPDNVIGADGKVITPRYKPPRKVVDPETAEITRIGRRDPTAKYFTTGTGEVVWGNKFVVASTRGDEENRRIITDIARCPRAGGEAKHAVAMLDQLLPLVPGAEVVVYDGELRGKHLNHLMTKHGIIPLARLHNKRGKAPLDLHYGLAPCRRPDGSKDTVDLHLVDGAPYVRDLDEAGDIILFPVERTKTFRRQRKDGRWRIYDEFAIPEEVGGGRVLLRCDQTAQDKLVDFKRAEHFRVIPDSDPDWGDLMGRRPDSESGNRIIDDGLPRERAHSDGDVAQHLDLLAHALQRNTRAVWIDQQRSSPPPLQLVAA